MRPALHRSMTYNAFPKTREFSSAKIPCGGGVTEKECKRAELLEPTPKPLEKET